MHLFYGIFERLSEENLYGAGILAPAVNYIEGNCFDSSVDIKMLADLSGICESYFRRLFVQKYNISPKSYIINLRLTYARQLLSESKLEVSQISESAAFQAYIIFAVPLRLSSAKRLPNTETELSECKFSICVYRYTIYDI